MYPYRKTFATESFIRKSLLKELISINNKLTYGSGTIYQSK